MSIREAARALLRKSSPPRDASPATGEAHPFADLDAYLRVCDMPGAAELVLMNATGTCIVVPLNARKVRIWNAKFAEIIARDK